MPRRISIVRFRHLFIAILAVGAAVVAGFLYGIFRHPSPLSDERFVLVLKNAFAVANPDYEIDFDFMANGPVPVDDGRRIPLAIEAQGDSLKSVEMQWRDDLFLSSGGKLKLPRMPERRMSRVLQKFGHPEGDTSKETALLLASLAPDTEVRAVIELKFPILESQMQGMWFSNLDAILLSSSQTSSKPISWDGGAIICKSRGFDICRGGQYPVALTEQFQQWVRLLKTEDEDLLHQLGLSLTELREVAGDGRIYGFIVTGAPNSVHALSNDPRVGTVKVTTLAPESWSP